MTGASRTSADDATIRMEQEVGISERPPPNLLVLVTFIKYIGKCKYKINGRFLHVMFEGFVYIYKEIYRYIK